MHCAAIIDAFIAEIAASQQCAEAVAGDAAWAKHLEDIEQGLRALWRLGDGDSRAIELFDEACRIIQSDDRMKLRMLGIQDVLVRASQTFDPAAWGGAKVGPSRS
jgi:hypothetical protein